MSGVKRSASDVSAEAKRPRSEKRCNWCLQYKPLKEGKPFCGKCAEKGTECSRCHQPRPAKYYTKSDRTCDTCLNKTTKSSIGGNVVSHTIKPTDRQRYDLLKFFSESADTVKTILRNQQDKHRGIKFYLTTKVRFVKLDADGEEMASEPVFRTRPSTVVGINDFDVGKHFAELQAKVEHYLRDGSGWTLDYIINLEVNTVVYKPLQANSYIPLPSYISHKKAILNIQNRDEKCFLWSILASLHPVSRKDNPNRVVNYIQYEHELNTEGLTFPVPIHQIPKFEKMNNLSINVIGYDEELFPVYISQHQTDRVINLLMISEDEQRHYCLIRNFSTLLGDRTKNCSQSFYCFRCFHGFTRQDLLDDHLLYCQKHGIQKIVMPDEKKMWLTFKSYQRQMKVPFAIYYDFECFTTKIDSCENSSGKSSTTKYQQHQHCSYGYKVVCEEPKYSKPIKIYRGPDVIDNFIDALLKEEERITEILSNIKPMNLSPAEERAFREADVCHIFQKLLGTDRVRDHCHLTGEFKIVRNNDVRDIFQ